MSNHLKSIRIWGLASRPKANNDRVSASEFKINNDVADMPLLEFAALMAELGYDKEEQYDINKRRTIYAEKASL